MSTGFSFMKYFHLLAVLALTLSALSCKKEDSVDDPNAGSTARFTVTGVRDVDMTLTTTAVSNLPVQVVTNAGALPDTVSLQVTGLPSGIGTIITPMTSKTTFSSRIQFVNTYNGPGGTFNVKVIAVGNSGTMTYPMILTVPGYLGWSFNDTAYTRTQVVKDNGLASGYPYIYINSQDGSRLVINFPYKSAIPKTAATYKVGSSTAEGQIQLQFIRDSTQVFVSTNVGNPTASFVFDTLGKFIFKCSDVQMSNGFRTGKLNASLPE